MRAGLDSHQQRLRLSDLWHFGRRRKAFEGGRKDGGRVGGTTGRLVKLGERQRRLQPEAPRALVARDGDGRAIGFLSAGGILGIGLCEDVAADAVQEGVGPVFSGLLRERQRFIDPRQGSLPVLPRGLELGQPALEERRKQLVPGRRTRPGPVEAL